MSRRGFIAGNVITLFVFPLQTSTAQQRKTPLLGWLSSAPGADPMFDAFRAGLRNLDYVEGRSIRIEALSVQSFVWQQRQSSLFTECVAGIHITIMVSIPGPRFADPRTVRGTCFAQL